MLIRVCDVETTGLPPDAAVCEVGWSDLWITDEETTIDPPVSRLCNPGRPMPPEARAVHHISDADVAGCPAPTVAFAELMLGANVFAAHNAAFEQQFFAGGGIPWICTYRCGLRAWPDSPSHKNQVLRYFLDLDIDGDKAMPPHRAGPDAFVSAHILRELLVKNSVDQLIKWSSEPALLVKVGFGKHRGSKWSEVPRDYLEWCLRQDMDADTKHTARHHLQRRAA